MKAGWLVTTLVLSLLWFGLFPRSLLAQPEQVKISLKGSWPGYDRGPAFDVVVASNRAYVAMGHSGLAIFDLSDPAKPTRLGAYPTAGVASFVQVVDHYAYVIEQGSVAPGSLEIVDVADPAHPVRVDSYAVSPYCQGVQVTGGYAYIADGGYGLQIVNVSAPANPVRAGAYTGKTAWAVDVVGNYAYVADSLDGLHIINISNPSAPFKAGSYGVNKRSRDVRVAGNYACMTVQTWTGSAYAGTLEVIDVSDPAHPVRVGVTATTGDASHVQFQGNYAYVLGQRWSGHYYVEELDIFDVSNPANPVRAGGARIAPTGTSGNVGGFFVSGDHACVAAQWGGWQVLDVRKPAQVTRLSGAEISGSASDVQVVGNYAYVADSAGGLQVIDVSDSDHPTRVGGYLAPGPVQRVRVAGNYAYVTGWTPRGSNDISTLQIIDVSQPTNPTPVSVFGNGSQDYGDLERLQILGNYAYLTGLIWDGSTFFNLGVLDVGDPTHPALAAVSGGDFFVQTLHLLDHYAYVVGYRNDPLLEDYFGVLEIFNLSNPTNLRSVGEIDIPGEGGKALQVVGDYAYIVGYSPFTVVNVSNPTNPVPIGVYQTDSPGLDIRVIDNYAYVLGQELQVIDVRNPNHPILAAQFHLNVDIDDDIALDVVGSHAYVAGGIAGLSILEITPAPQFRSISRLGQNISLSWNGAPGLKLQRATTLSNPVWTDVPNSEGQSSMQVPVGNGHEFFKLTR